MCGIAGILLPAAQPADVLRRVTAMADAEQHRGPDDSGVELVASAPVVAFSHRRLAIIDTSSAGHQPMVEPASGVWVTFNGEIYNFRELRALLEGKGHEFRTRTDTEVILRSYIEWGAGFPERLRGIFAFGIWDPRTSTLLLVRDQLGVKPLYYWESAGQIAFASEVRAVLASGLVNRTLDVTALRGYLAFGSVQEPSTLVHGVRSLSPGHVLAHRSGNTTVRRYWSLPVADPRQPSVRVTDERIREALEDAASSQLVSDVPLGAFLSGGIDSTAVTALTQRASARPMRTFSLVFDESEYDERSFSRLAADRIGTDHCEVLLTGSQVRGSAEAALDAFDQPSMDGLNTYFVSQAARQSGLTVALSGLGGDEVFGGYDGFARSLRVERWSNRLATVPVPMRRAASHLLARAARTEPQRRAAELLEGTTDPYLLSRQLFGRRQVAALLNGSGEQGPDETENRWRGLVEETRPLDPVNRVAALELQTYMLSTLLRDTDQMSMANSLEVRVPLLDHHLVELLFAMPGFAKIDPVIPKVLLTRPLGSMIPQECVYRPKRGFELPLAKWLRGTLEAEVRESFLGNADPSPFRRKGLEAVWGEFTSGRVGWSRVWSIFVLRRWLERHDVRS